MLVFMYGCLNSFVLFLVVLMFSFGCFTPVKRLAGKIVSLLNSTQSSTSLVDVMWQM